MVYFIMDADYGVKIGYTRDPDAKWRLSSLQAGNPRPLTVVGVVDDGGPGLEKRLHRILRAQRIRGEWFKLEEGVAKAARHAAAPGATSESILALLGSSLHARDLSAAQQRQIKALTLCPDWTLRASIAKVCALGPLIKAGYLAERKVEVRDGLYRHEVKRTDAGWTHLEELLDEDA